ncbi:MAG TPA: two-component regulator propeller domain-containing protein [Steroidobacteraceae bacterium]|nr:two-component regulator propeller domain-containing protein [Steroidobacteraceae bacterium]
MRAAFVKTLCRLVIAAALLATAPLSFAAERWAGLSDTVFQHLARDNELPNSATPTAVSQDRDGFLWIGSQNGLARWDGYHLRVYRSEPGKPGALPDNFIQTLLTDSRGILWVGTTSGGLARFDREHDRFVVYPVGRDGLSHVSVRAIAEDGDGGVWVATEGGLDHVRPDSSPIAHMRHSDRDLDSLPDNRVRGLLRDRAGTLWVGTATGLSRLERGSTQFVPVPLPIAHGKLPSPWSFLEDSAGRIWVGTLRQGAYVIESRNAPAKLVEELDTAHAALQNEGVSAIVETVPGQIWIGTFGRGIVAIDTATGHSRRIRHDAVLPASLPDDSIQAMFKDRAGTIWICTDRSVSRYDAAQSAVLTVFGASSRTDSISESNVNAVQPMPDGRVWLGLDSLGVDIIDPTVGRVAELRPDPSRPESALPRDYINAFAAAPNGDVYVGSEQGLYRVDRLVRGATRIPIPQRDAGAQVWALLLDGNVLWVGGFDGLWSLNLAQDRARIVTHAETASGLTDQRITVIERGEGDALWVGTKNGLNRIDLASHHIEKILPDPTNPSALAAGYITSLLTDSHGRLWVATFGGGVNVLEARDAAGRPHFRRIGITQGLNNENSNKLLEDRQRTIWVSTDDGLATIDERTFAVRTIRRAEGLPITSYWVGSGAATPQGELLFGGVGGLTVVRPERLAQWQYQPPLVITDIRVGGQPVPPGSVSLNDPGHPLTITSRANSLAVEFAALDFSAPERNRYAYRLEGFDANWIDTATEHRLAAYTNLPPGDYTLQLRGSNRDGVWAQNILRVPVHVLPAWYQTAAFRIAVILGALALVAAVVQGRTVYLRRSQRDLERQVVERTAELRESQRQLEQIAYFDTLTALPNRRRFTEEFRELLVLARLQNQRFALLLIDLDRFKQINDSRGHDAGDALLIEAAIRLQAAVRKSDCVARLGGDEFGVLVAHNPAASDIENICHRIIEGFMMPVPVSGAAVTSSASIGVAVYPDHGATLDSLYKSADVALYEAKRAGGNLWRWYKSQTNTSSTGQFQVRIK